MKIKEVMSPNPVCCTPGDSAQMVAPEIHQLRSGHVP